MRVLFVGLALALAVVVAQETPQEKKFFEVKITKDEIYSYNGIKFAGDYTSWESPSGQLALGRTEGGVTILVILGRINPKEFEEIFDHSKWEKPNDEAAFTKSKALVDEKFLGSYHAGPLAIFPPYKTRFMDFDTPDLGQIVNEEGYWLILRRFAPYKSVYPPKFVNPKQK